MGVTLEGSKATTLTPVGAARLNCPTPVPRLRLPDGNGPVAFVVIRSAGVQGVGGVSCGPQVVNAPESVMR